MSHERMCNTAVSQVVASADTSLGVIFTSDDTNIPLPFEGIKESHNLV